MAILIRDESPPCLQDIFHRKLIPCTPRTLRKGESLWRDNEPHPYCYFIRSGLIKLCAVTAAGREMALFFYTRGALFGFQNLSNRRKTITAAVAMLPTTLYAAEFSAVYALISGNPRYQRALTEYLFCHMLAEAREIVDVNSSDTDDRLAALLVLLADEYVAAGQGEAVISLNNDELASLIGACRNSINNAVSALQKRKLIRKHRGQIEIVDLDRLRRFKGRKGEVLLEPVAEAAATENGLPPAAVAPLTLGDVAQ